MALVDETCTPFRVAERQPHAAMLALAALLFALVWLGLTPNTADATSYVVTKVADTNDGSCNSDCSLREAITAANASSATPHTITFSISAGCLGSCIIAVTSALPTISRPTTLNGTGAPTGRIFLTRSGSFTSDGLTIGTSGSVTVRGFGIYGFAGNGIRIQGGNNHVVAGNIIGLDQTGALSGSLVTGITIADADGTRIGGSTAADRNVIAGSAEGILILNATTQNTVIKGNYIGTSIDGLSARANEVDGIRISSAASTTIGGATTAERNVIAGNGFPGLTGHGITMSNATDTVITGNYIGVAANGSALGNLGDGINITGGTTHTTIGDAADPNAANTIAYNGLAGIRLPNAGPTGNRFLRNSILSNGGLGIDLGALGPTLNDVNDADDGPNGLQNFPTIVSAGVGGGQTVIAGALTAKPDHPYSVSFFVQTECDSSGYGEGLAYLTSTSFTTAGTGFFNFRVPFPAVLPLTARISSLATDLVTFDTSEFSLCVPVQATGVVVTPTVGLQTTEAGGQATFTIKLATFPSDTVSIPISSSDTSEGTVTPAQVIFTPLNAGTLQTVTITGVPDGVGDGNVIYRIVLGAAVSNDPGYNALDPPDPQVTNADIDVDCSPRPRVSVTTTPESPERLRVTLSATGQNNTLSSIHVTSTVNAEVENGGPAQTGTFVLPLGNAVSASFVVHRRQTGQAATVRAFVVDGCGNWPTFFGGGPSGFP